MRSILVSLNRQIKKNEDQNLYVWGTKKSYMGVVANHASVKIKFVRGDLIDRYMSLVEVYYKLHLKSISHRWSCKKRKYLIIRWKYQ